MKRILIVLLLLMVSFSGCIGINDSSDSGDTSTVNTVPASEFDNDVWMEYKSNHVEQYDDELNTRLGNYNDRHNRLSLVELAVYEIGEDEYKNEFHGYKVDYFILTETISEYESYLNDLETNNEFRLNNLHDLNYTVNIEYLNHVEKYEEYFFGKVVNW